MVVFFRTNGSAVIAVETSAPFDKAALQRLTWLFDGAKYYSDKSISGIYIGPRKEMISPWSTNAVEICRNMGIDSITRIERYRHMIRRKEAFDKMLKQEYYGLDQNLFTTNIQTAPIEYITDIDTYDKREGLALSKEEKQYLHDLSQRLGRPLTDSEVFGFSQVNSEHCRHKIFNGTFIIDGEEKPLSLFKLIKKTSAENPNGLISAYKDNVAFVRGPIAMQFAPKTAEQADFFEEKEIQTVISLKAETHNFPTTVEPFNGAATGTGGEIRDRLGGGKASLPIAGTAVYMTSYPRINGMRAFERNAPEPRPWLYQSPESILIKASNGASDFGNKFGQPLICGSVLTFEHEENEEIIAYDKVIMLAGGVGFGTLKDAIKGKPEPGMSVVVMGGDNYRIGMGGGAVSSVATGEYANSIELNAVQRANPEMQKRVSNVIRALAEMEENPCVSIHDHGAGGHLNALSELVEATGGKIEMKELPIGDTTLSAKEIIGNESQERMGLVAADKDIETIRRIAEREQAPFYVVGHTTADSRFVFEQADGVRPIDLAMADMFGNSPKTVMTDSTVEHYYTDAPYVSTHLEEYIDSVFRLEAVACKDWLTNKVDRSVTGRVARQQCLGEIQLPLSDCGVVALDYRGRKGIATSVGHAPQAALIDPAAGSVLAIAEALTNICCARLEEGIKSVSLSANWMWPCHNPGEDARLYAAVEACSKFACDLGINIPTGKDSLSMTQKYGDKKVLAPGTVIISAAAPVADIRSTVSPVLVNNTRTMLIYVDMSSDGFKLGGSAFEQSLNKIGSDAPTVKNPAKFVKAFSIIQKLIAKGLVLAQHDVSAGGLITTILEMTFPNRRGGIKIDISNFEEPDLIKVLFSEKPAVVMQFNVKHVAYALSLFEDADIEARILGIPQSKRELWIKSKTGFNSLEINSMRDKWYSTSWELDSKQTRKDCAFSRLKCYKSQPLKFQLPPLFTGKLSDLGLSFDRKPSGIRAAIIRDKGINGDREMAYSLYLAGFDVKDVHMTDLRSGRETLEDVNMIVFCGGFSNSDVLGSAKGWAGAFKYNDNARTALKNFYKRTDTLSLGVCNGCQLMMELDLITHTPENAIKMLPNNSGKFESAFLSVEIPENNSVMFGNMAGTKLGIWVAHGEGKFHIPRDTKNYQIVLRYCYSTYPGNPNGSPLSIAGIVSTDGRHLAMMPHLERAIFPWQCAHYPNDRKSDEVTPWIIAFVNARKWIEEHKSM